LFTCQAQDIEFFKACRTFEVMGQRRHAIGKELAGAAPSNEEVVCEAIDHEAQERSSLLLAARAKEMEDRRRRSVAALTSRFEGERLIVPSGALMQGVEHAMPLEKLQHRPTYDRMKEESFVVTLHRLDP
jgi:hypothetical protein